MDPTCRELENELLSHPLYGRLDSPAALRRFMEAHVICVWDFMALLKSLQRDLTGGSEPWVPPADSEGARLVNEIVLAEESDHVAPGRYGSHLEWYIEAMAEVGADTAPVERLVAALRAGTKAAPSLGRCGLPPHAERFAQTTLELLERPLHVRVAVAFHARLDLVPRLFVALVESLSEATLECERLIAFLRRHVEAKADARRLLAARLLDRLHDGDPNRERESADAVADALRARRRLWDATLGALEEATLVG